MEQKQINEATLIELVELLYQEIKDDTEMTKDILLLNEAEFTSKYFDYFLEEFKQNNSLEMGSQIYCHCYAYGIDNPEQIVKYFLKHFRDHSLIRIFDLKRGDRVVFYGNEKYNRVRGSFVWHIYQPNKNFPQKAYIIQHPDGIEMETIYRNNPDAQDIINKQHLKQGLKYILVTDIDQLSPIQYKKYEITFLLDIVSPYPEDYTRKDIVEAEDEIEAIKKHAISRLKKDSSNIEFIANLQGTLQEIIKELCELGYESVVEIPDQK